MPTIDLRKLLRATLPADGSAPDVRVWYGDPAPLLVDAAQLDLLVSRWVAETPKHIVAERAPVIDALRRAGEAGHPIAYNAVFRERHGGRRYVYIVPGHKGSVVLSHGAHEKLPKPRVILQSFPGDLRAAVRAAEGHVLLDVDIRNCFLAIAAVLTRDQVLAQDLAGDMHQRIGDRIWPDLDAARRRDLGKLVNNSAVGGVTAVGLAKSLRDEKAEGVAAERILGAWWRRYAAFGTAKAKLDGWVRDVAQDGVGIEVISANGRRFKFSPAEVRGERPIESLVTADMVEDAQAHACRSIISSLWRAIEGDVLDRALQLLHPARASIGLRIAIPMYDGAVFVAPKAGVAAGEAAIRAAFGQALREANLAATIKVVARPRWGEAPAGSTP